MFSINIRQIYLFLSLNQINQYKQKVLMRVFTSMCEGLLNTGRKMIRKISTKNKQKLSNKVKYLFKIAKPVVVCGLTGLLLSKSAHAGHKHPLNKGSQQNQKKIKNYLEDNSNIPIQRQVIDPIHSDIEVEPQIVNGFADREHLIEENLIRQFGPHEFELNGYQAELNRYNARGQRNFINYLGRQFQDTGKE